MLSFWHIFKWFDNHFLEFNFSFVATSLHTLQFFKYWIFFQLKIVAYSLFQWSIHTSGSERIHPISNIVNCEAKLSIGMPGHIFMHQFYIYIYIVKSLMWVEIFLYPAIAFIKISLTETFSYDFEWFQELYMWKSIIFLNFLLTMAMLFSVRCVLRFALRTFSSKSKCSEIISFAYSF